MFVNELEEFKMHFPTTTWEDVKRLSGLIEDTEDSFVVPLLGRKLYEELIKEYARLKSSILPDAPIEGLEEKDVATIKVLRVCQSIDIYMTLANNSGIMSVSINQGGGFNSVTASNYEAADAKVMDRFTKDTYMKAHRSIDRLLILLEEDSLKESPFFSSLWKGSEYFFQQNDTLFLTAREFNRYVNIDMSREKFISLQADIRYCQDVYLYGECGVTLIKTFIKSLTDKSIRPTEDVASKVWDRTLNLLRMALALYVEGRNAKIKRQESRGDADLALARSKNIIKANREVFANWLDDSPLKAKGVPPTATSPKKGYISGAIYDEDDPDNIILDLPGFGGL